MKAAQKVAIQNILKQMQTQSGQIQNYNFRNFFLRKTNEKMVALDAIQIVDGNTTNEQHVDVGEEMIQKFE